eukprot:SAG11_NODE_474_length_9142_cov_6.507907_2_plen_83_part_00
MDQESCCPQRKASKQAVKLISKQCVEGHRSSGKRKDAPNLHDEMACKKDNHRSCEDRLRCRRIGRCYPYVQVQEVQWNFYMY